MFKRKQFSKMLRSKKLTHDDGTLLLGGNSIQIFS
jgi:hypothetical protein